MELNMRGVGLLLVVASIFINGPIGWGVFFLGAYLLFFGKD